MQVFELRIFLRGDDRPGNELFSHTKWYSVFFINFIDYPTGVNQVIFVLGNMCSLPER